MLENPNSFWWLLPLPEQFGRSLILHDSSSSLGPAAVERPLLDTSCLYVWPQLLCFRDSSVHVDQMVDGVFVFGLKCCIWVFSFVIWDKRTAPASPTALGLWTPTVLKLAPIKKRATARSHRRWEHAHKTLLSALIKISKTSYGQTGSVDCGSRHVHTWTDMREV